MPEKCLHAGDIWLIFVYPQTKNHRTANGRPMFIEVAVNVPSEKTFIYGVPEGLGPEVAPGKRVLAPFGKKKVTGYILGTASQGDREDIREIIEVLDAEPLFNEDDLRLYRWAADYYMYPLGKALAEILPGGINIESDRWVFPAAPATDTPLTDQEREIIKIFGDHAEGISIRSLRKKAKSDILKDIRLLEKKGLIRVEDRLARPGVKSRLETAAAVNPALDPEMEWPEKEGAVIGLLREEGETGMARLRRECRVTADFLRRMEKKGMIEIFRREVYRRPAPGPEIGEDCGDLLLNDAQQAALAAILGGLRSGEFSPYLLHGVTGSGKTEIYLRALKEALAMGGSAILLVPEIALTPQLLSRINRRFSEGETAVLHSGVSRAVRYDQWRRISRGEIRIMVGARSAVFAPARDLKLIIVDEEHDGSYKQDDRMRYNARDLALVKARQQQATVVLGSATPGMQSYFNARSRKYHYLALPGRAGERALPEVEILDMRREKEERAGAGILSERLKTALRETLAAGGQTLLFLNRRGFHTFLFCADCGYVLRCLNCSVSLTHHAAEGSLRCHYCDFSLKAPPICPSCRGGRVRNYGSGTERLEDEISGMFPGARTARLDSDTTSRKGAQEKILQAFDRREIDILVGTQMITKGHDYPHVHLVGVVMADASLNVPDFRAAEHTFQLLTQVSGRGGRGDVLGRVIIQTFNPEHYAIRLAREQNYQKFFDEEIAHRRELGYPPFSRIVNLHISGLRKDLVEAGAKGIRDAAITVISAVAGRNGVDLIGPAEAPIAKLKGRYRWQLILKGGDIKKLHAVVRGILAEKKRRGLEIRVDVDPMNFM